MKGEQRKSDYAFATVICVTTNIYICKVTFKWASILAVEANRFWKSKMIIKSETLTNNYMPIWQNDVLGNRHTLIH